MVNRRLITEFVDRIGVPAIYPFKEFAEAGGLMSYGAIYEALYRRAATYVDRS
jgi:hypothetical protein